MSLNQTPSSERIHIGIFGNRNAGKSTLINAITGQDLAVVSDVAGTTTDPVKKAMEILPLGPVVLIDTPGIDDIGELGAMRVKKAKEVVDSCDIAILVLDLERAFEDINNPNVKEISDKIKDKNIPSIVVLNKIDESKLAPLKGHLSASLGIDEDRLYLVSALNLEGIEELKEGIAHIIPKKKKMPLISDLVGEGEDIILVIPIDESAPKGRIILPQQQVIRDALGVGAFIHVCKDTEYAAMLKSLDNTKNLLVVTDSQAFKKISELTPENVRLTSFSILMARYKGDLKWQVEGAREISNLKDGDKVLISEGCTHHRQCNDIGTVKMPNWVRSFSGADVEFAFTSGGEFPEDLSEYKLIIHCGACTLNAEQMKSRIKRAVAAK
nr:[FeFe] hydrogenase H-cluster maturation GTPase HydF [Lachnospiraceae bacterium]